MLFFTSVVSAASLVSASPELLGVSEADGVGEGGVPEVRGRAAQRLVPVSERRAEQRREQRQQLVVVRHGRAALQAAEDVAEKLLQLNGRKPTFDL